MTSFPTNSKQTWVFVRLNQATAFKLRSKMLPEVPGRLFETINGAVESQYHITTAIEAGRLVDEDLFTGFEVGMNEGSGDVSLSCTET